MMSSPTVCFHWRSDVTQTGLACQVVEIELLRPDRLMFPQDLPELRLPSELDPQKGVILTGRAPIWLYGWLVHACHYTRWVACYDPRLGAVVVSTHHPEVRLGEVLQLQSQGKRARLAAAVMVESPQKYDYWWLNHALGFVTHAFGWPVARSDADWLPIVDPPCGACVAIAAAAREPLRATAQTPLVSSTGLTKAHRPTTLPWLLDS